MATERSEINRHNHVILGGKHHVGGLDIAVTVGFVSFYRSYSAEGDYLQETGAFSL